MSGFSSTPDSTATVAFAITPSDSAEVNVRAVYVGVGGNVALRSSGSAASVVFQNVPAGSVLPVRARLVLSTGTTASGLIGLA